MPGYDVTVPIFVDANTNELNVGDATVYVPAQSDPTEWIHDRQAKEAYVGGSGLSTLTRKQYPLDPRASERIRTYCKTVGVDFFARQGIACDVPRGALMPVLSTSRCKGPDEAR